MTIGVCKRHSLSMVASMPLLRADAGSIVPPIERPSENNGPGPGPGSTPVVGRPASDLGEPEFPIESAGSLIIFGNIEQQTPAASTAQSVRDGCQHPSGNAAAPKLRKDTQSQYLGFRPDRKGNHEPHGLILDMRQGPEAAGHRQKLGDRGLVPGIAEATGMQRGRDRQIERPERLQQDVEAVVAVHQRFDAAVLDASALATGDDRTSGARRYNGVGGNPVRSATDRAAICATQKASAGPSAAA